MGLSDEPPLEVGDCPEDMEHQLAGGRGRVDAFLEADQVDVVRFQVLDRFEQLLEGAPEAIQAGDTQAVAGAGMVNEFALSTRGAGLVDGGFGADEAEADVVDGVAGGVEADEPCPAFAQHADGESGVADAEAGGAGPAREPDRSYPLVARACEVESPAVGDEDDAVPARAGVVGAYRQAGEVRVDESDAGFAAAVDLDGGGSVVGRRVGRCLSDLSADIPVAGAKSPRPKCSTSRGTFSKV